MRVLHIINTMNPASGGTAAAVRMFLGPGHSVATLDIPSDPWANGTICLGPGRGKYGFSRTLSLWLRENIHSFDALIVHGLWQHHGVAVRRAALRSAVPYFVFPHGMLDPYFEKASPLKHLKKLAYWRIESAVLRDAAAVLFTAEEERRNAFSSFKLTCESRIVPLGVHDPAPGDPEDFFTRYPETRGKRLILFLSRIHPKKGLDLLLRAFVDREDYHLVVAGPMSDPTYEADIRKLARGLPVTFTGMIEGRMKSAALAAAEALALPSHQENFAVAVAEALAVGVPVLISNKINIWREIAEDRAGFIAPDTLEGTKELLHKWVKLSEIDRAAMSAAARACYEKRFRAECSSARLEETLREFACKRSNR